MERKEAIRRLNVLIERGQDKTNEAIKLAVQSLQNDDVTCKDCSYRMIAKDFSYYWCKRLHEVIFLDGNACQWFEEQ